MGYETVEDAPGEVAGKCSTIDFSNLDRTCGVDIVDTVVMSYQWYVIDGRIGIYRYTSI